MRPLLNFSTYYIHTLVKKVMGQRARILGLKSLSIFENDKNLNYVFDPSFFLHNLLLLFASSDLENVKIFWVIVKGTFSSSHNLREL